MKSFKTPKLYTWKIKVFDSISGQFVSAAILQASNLRDALHEVEKVYDSNLYRFVSSVYQSNEVIFFDDYQILLTSFIRDNYLKQK